LKKVELKPYRAKAKGRVYYYAWLGGPRLRAEYGSSEFYAEFVEALQERHFPDRRRFLSLVVSYRASPDFLNLATSTRSSWSRWLDIIADYFGPLSVAQFDRPEKIRQVIRKWRNRYADKPRTADFGMQVLSRVLSHGVETGRLAGNSCEGIKRLYGGGSRAEIIWTPSDIARLKTSCSAEIGHAVDLAAATGLRLDDLRRLAWSHVGPEAIIIATGKSRGRREAVIPLYDALCAVLAAIPKRATTVLTNSRGRPWSNAGLRSSFALAKKAAGIGSELHFHDLRGTAATFFYTAGLSERVVAEIMGWEEEHVAKIIRRFDFLVEPVPTITRLARLQIGNQLFLALQNRRYGMQGRALAELR
jgi:integrase